MFIPVPFGVHTPAPVLPSSAVTLHPWTIGNTDRVFSNVGALKTLSTTITELVSAAGAPIKRRFELASLHRIRATKDAPWEF